MNAGSRMVTSLGPSVGRLLRLQVRISIRSFQRARPRQKAATIVLGLVALALLAGAFVASDALLGFLRSPGLASSLNLTGLVGLLPGLILSSAFVAILLTGFGVLLQGLYLAQDMDFLLSAPVPIRAVFVSKTLQAILPNFGLIALFGLPVLFGMGAAQGYRLPFYPMVILVLIALALAAGGVSSLAVMLVVHVVPPRRVAELLAFLGVVVSLLCSQSGQFASRLRIGSGQASQALSLAARFNSPWSPLAWAGRGLVNFGQGDWFPGTVQLVLFLGICSGVFLLAIVTAERLYISGWAGIQAGTRARRPASASLAPHPASGAGARKKISLLPSPIRAIVVKDAQVLRRDLRNMGQLVTPLIVGMVYAVMLVTRTGTEGPVISSAPSWLSQATHTLWLYANVAISVFVAWTLALRLSLMGISQEGRSYWLLKSSPVSAAQLLVSKFLVGFLPSLALGEVLLLVVSVLGHAGAGPLLFGVLAVGFVLAGNTGLALALGVTGANLTWEDPRHMVSGVQGCLGTLACSVYLAVTLGLFLGAPAVLPLLRVGPVVAQILGLLLGGVVAISCTVLPLLLVLPRVSMVGEA